MVERTSTTLGATASTTAATSGRPWSSGALPAAGVGVGAVAEAGVASGAGGSVGVGAGRVRVGRVDQHASGRRRRNRQQQRGKQGGGVHTASAYHPMLEAPLRGGQPVARIEARFPLSRE